MNKNKKIAKAMSSVLCASMLMGSVTPVFASTNETQSTSTNDTKEVEVTYNQSATYEVTIPKTISLDSNKEYIYNVKVEGDIPSNKNVYVAPQDAISQTEEIDFYMHDQSTKNPKADVTATVTQNKDTWDFEDVANGYEETNNKISASQLTAGNWKGTFNFNINLKDIESYGEDVTLASSNLATYGIANSGDVTIPSVVTDSDGVKHKVTGIRVYAFDFCSGLTSITIPDSVAWIGAYAFSNCSGLTSIKIPDSVTSIDDYVFYECKKLTSLNIPKGVTSIGECAFRGCSSLTSINIPEGVTSIGDMAFYGCNSLTTINIPDSVTSIGQSAFSGCNGCSGLTSITVNQKNTVFDSRNNCNAIIETSTNKLITGCNNTIIPNSVTSIGSSAFSSCSGLTSIKIPDSVTSIGDCAFSSCRGLTSINIPNSVTSIGQQAFLACSSLTSINIPDSVTSIGQQAFWGCSSLTSINIPDSVTSIEDEAFSCCGGLTSVTYKGTNYTNQTTLTNALTSNGVSVGSNAFQYTKLQ